MASNSASQFRHGLTLWRTNPDQILSKLTLLAIVRCISLAGIAPSLLPCHYWLYWRNIPQVLDAVNSRNYCHRGFHFAKESFLVPPGSRPGNQFVSWPWRPEDCKPHMFQMFFPTYKMGQGPLDYCRGFWSIFNLAFILIALKASAR
jgi:hypothetical protein